MTEKYDALISAPFGSVAISVNDGQLAVELLFAPTSPSVQLVRVSVKPLLVETCNQILSYLEQPATAFDLPVAQTGTAFQQRVWRAIAAIPPGQVRTYGQLAREIGSGPRAVANACGANHLPLIIPCHRVVAQHGLGGFMQGKEKGLLIKQWLLQHEGLDIGGL